MTANFAIQHRIFTLAELYDPFEFRGFTFAPWNYDPVSGTCGDAWIAIRSVRADSADEAFNKFHDELEVAVDRIGFVSQCFTSLIGEAFAVEKIDDNPSRTFFFRYAERTGPAPLMFMEKEVAALEALEKYVKNDAAFRFLREACAGTTFYTRVSMLISALEALAGEVEYPKTRNKRTNTLYIRENILKNDQLFTELYKYGEGVRPQLFHGKLVDFSSEERRKIDFIKEIYQAILRYFREVHGVEIETDIVGPMRGPLGDYRVWSSWLRPIDEKVDTSLFSVHSKFRATQEPDAPKPDISFNKSFELLSKIPNGY